MKIPFEHAIAISTFATLLYFSIAKMLNFSIPESQLTTEFKPNLNAFPSHFILPRAVQASKADANTNLQKYNLIVVSKALCAMTNALTGTYNNKVNFSLNIFWDNTKLLIPTSIHC